MYYGKHLLVEAITASPKYLTDKRFITKILRTTAKISKMKIVKPVEVYKFPPQKSSISPGGITAFCIVAESHISIHTWPENNYFAFDLFSCRDFEEKEILQVLKKSFSIKKIHTQIIERGISVNF